MSVAVSEVTPIINQARTDASALITTGLEFLHTVMELAGFEIDIEPAPTLADVVAVGMEMGNQTDAEVQTIFHSYLPRPVIPFATATPPESPTMGAVPTILFQSVPDLTAVSPLLDLPTLPAVSMPAAPGVGPTFRDPVIPDAPTLTMPALPVFANIVIPPPPTISVASFDKTLTLVNLVAPTNQFSWAETAYASALLDAVKAKLLGDLENGSYGIDLNDEIRLYDRARTKVNRAADAQMDDIVTTHAARGWSKPSGSLSADLQRGRQALLDQHANIASDVMVKRADLFNATRKFTIEQSIELEKILIAYHNSVQERSLNAAKATIEMVIALFDSQVKQHNYYLERYKAEIQVFAEQTRAGVAQAEIYRSQMLAVESQVGIQRNQVEVYRAQLLGVEAIVNIYKARMEGANIAASIERTRFEAFRSTIDAYVAQIQGKTAEFALYEAKIRGEVAKITAFEAQVRAYGMQVEAAKVKSSMDVEVMRGAISRNELLIQKYVADISRYRGELEQGISNVNSLTTQYGIDVTAWTTKLNAVLKAFDLRQSGSRLYFDAIKLDMGDKMDRARLRYEELLNSAKVRVETAEFGTTFIGNQITASLNAINTLAASVENK